MFALGLLLVLTGAALAAAEAHVPSHGALGGSGIVALAAGVALLVAATGSGAFAAIFAGLIVAAAGGTALYTMVLKALSVRRLGTSSNSLIGRVGIARASDRVFVDGELWRARTWGIDEDERPITTGDHVVVENVKGLTLTVRPAEEWELL